MNRYRNPQKVATFYRSLTQMGVVLMVNLLGEVIASGPAVSPALQEEVDKRAEALRPLILAEPDRQAEVAAPAFVPVGEATDADYRMLRVVKGGRRKRK